MEVIRDFTQLNVWQKGHVLVLNIYKITRKFPKEEKFGLVDQMRRAAVSVTSNIAEGFGRRSWKDKAQFYVIASGSLIELKNQLYVAKDVDYISKSDFEQLNNLAVEVSKMINGMIRKARER